METLWVSYLKVNLNLAFPGKLSQILSGEMSHAESLQETFCICFSLLNIAIDTFSFIVVVNNGIVWNYFITFLYNRIGPIFSEQSIQK